MKSIKNIGTFIVKGQCFLWAITFINILLYKKNVQRNKN